MLLLYKRCKSKSSFRSFGSCDDCRRIAMALVLVLVLGLEIMSLLGSSLFHHHKSKCLSKVHFHDTSCKILLLSKISSQLSLSPTSASLSPAFRKYLDQRNSSDPLRTSQMTRDPIMRSKIEKRTRRTIKTTPS